MTPATRAKRRPRVMHTIYAVHVTVGGHARIISGRAELRGGAYLLPKHLAVAMQTTTVTEAAVYRTASDAAQANLEHAEYKLNIAKIRLAEAESGIDEARRLVRETKAT